MAIFLLRRRSRVVYYVCTKRTPSATRTLHHKTKKSGKGNSENVLTSSMWPLQCCCCSWCCCGAAVSWLTLTLARSASGLSTRPLVSLSGPRSPATSLSSAASPASTDWWRPGPSQPQPRPWHWRCRRKVIREDGIWFKDSLFISPFVP